MTPRAADRGLGLGAHVTPPPPGELYDACITCGDVAIPARVVELTHRGALVERDGGREEIACELVEAVVVGDLLLCHAGVALQRLESGDGT